MMTGKNSNLVIRFAANLVFGSVAEMRRMGRCALVHPGWPIQILITSRVQRRFDFPNTLSKDTKSSSGQKRAAKRSQSRAENLIKHRW
jgi:hypothetical protein